YHPHPRAGGSATGSACRVYVASRMRPPARTTSETNQIRDEIGGDVGGGGGGGAVEHILVRAAQVLGVLTRELGVAAGPSLDEAVLERLELLRVSTERLLLVLTLRSGVVRTIFVEVRSAL